MRANPYVSIHFLTDPSAEVARPELVHYRVLFGPPRHADLTEPLLRLLDLRDPHDRSLGLKILHSGAIIDELNAPERVLLRFGPRRCRPHPQPHIRRSVRLRRPARRRSRRAPERPRPPV